MQAGMQGCCCCCCCNGVWNASAMMLQQLSLWQQHIGMFRLLVVSCVIKHMSHKMHAAILC
jgi:hypothetical protein